MTPSQSPFDTPIPSFPGRDTTPFTIPLPLSPTPYTPITMATDPTDTETSTPSASPTQDDAVALNANNQLILATILATTQSHRKQIQAILKPPTKGQQPLWQDPKLDKLIGRLISAKNATRGDGTTVSEREMEQVKELRKIIGELVKWDKKVLKVREWVLEKEEID
ncbi:MAG: hypothetical protein Q9213_004664 [Squamulea squamosa]